VSARTLQRASKRGANFLIVESPDAAHQQGFALLARQSINQRLHPRSKSW
jgi:hypothetical protein